MEDRPVGANVGGTLVQDGWEVYSADDQKIGHITEAHPNYALVEKGWLFKKDLYIPMSAMQRTDPASSCVYLSVDKDQIGDMGWENMPMETTTSTTTATGQTADSGTVQLREENLAARKRMEQAGEVEVGKRVVSEQQTMDVPVTHEEVTIERRPVDARPTEGTISERDEQTIRVPLSREEVDVEKRPVVTEEISIHKTPVTENKTVSGTVRREEPVIEKSGEVESANVTGTTGERLHEHRFVNGTCTDCGLTE